MAAQQLLDGEAQEITRKVIELATGGNPVALKLCLERVLPPRKDRPISLKLPEVKTVSDVPQEQPEFAKSLGISKETLIYYQKDRRHPDSVFLSNLCKIYTVNPAWLLLGEGEQISGDAGRTGGKEEKIAASDIVLQLLQEEEERAGVNLTPEQPTAILKILRELVYRDVSSIQELLRSIPGEGKKGMNRPNEFQGLAYDQIEFNNYNHSNMD